MSGARSHPDGAESTATPPLDLLELQLLRIQVFYLSGLGLWISNLLADTSLLPHGDRGPYRLGIEAAAAILAAATAWFTRYGSVSFSTKAAVGVFGIIPHAFALAILNSWTPQPIDVRPLSGTTVLLLFFGMMAPGRPRPMLISGLIAASMDPLGVWITHMRGLPAPGPLQSLALFYPNFVCALLAVAPARLLEVLGRKLRAARSLGSYQLLEKLGRGGMGEVWRGRHRLLARAAAIKLIRPEMLGVGWGKTSMMVRRFRREAQATAALTSPHTIRVYDFGLSDRGSFYYVMELLAGRDLDSLVRTFGPLPAARATAIIRQVCLSLAEAHVRGLVHRDVKPANIFLCRMGLQFDFVKVLDFGLVKNDRSHAETVEGPPSAAAIGTPGYMAPEVILGSGSADAVSDVYALGCVAYFLLTGQTVFKGDSPIGTLMLHLESDPPPPSQRSELVVPRGLDAFVMTCLKKNPAERPQNAGEALVLLNRLCAFTEWTEGDAAQWWRNHLPELAADVPVAIQDWDDAATPVPVPLILEATKALPGVC